MAPFSSIVYCDGRIRCLFSNYMFYFQLKMSGAGSSGSGRRGTTVTDGPKNETKESKPNAKMSKSINTSSKRYAY